MVKINKLTKLILISQLLALALQAFCAQPTTEKKLLNKSEQADLVAFSFDRPMQLYALLESAALYIKDLGQTHVIYRTSNNDFEAGYAQVKSKFPNVIFHKQGSYPALDFKDFTIKAAFSSPSKYILFAVDDIIVKSKIDIDQCIGLLKKTGAYGFYLRLGKNIDFCYIINQPSPPTGLKIVQDGVYSWVFNDGKHDWRYPNTVDMTLFKKSDIEPAIKSINYTNPNWLEGYWSCYDIQRTINKSGLCFEESKIVNLPLNIVQNAAKNRNMNAFSTKELLDKFNSGLKMDIAQVGKLKNRSAHVDFIPNFIKRDK